MDFLALSSTCRCEGCSGRSRCAFAGLPDELRRELDGIGRPCSFAPGTVLFLQGEPADGVLLLREGWAKLFHTSPEGDVTSIAVMGPGSILGLPEVLSGRPRPLGAEAICLCHLELMAAEPFLRFTRRHGDVAQRLLGSIGQDLFELLVELSRAAGRQDSQDRLLGALQKLAADCGRPRNDGVRIGLSFTVQDLADRIGCSRQWTSKLLSDLEGDGMIHRRKGWITLTDRGLTASLAS